MDLFVEITAIKSFDEAAEQGLVIEIKSFGVAIGAEGSSRFGDVLGVEANSSGGIEYRGLDIEIAAEAVGPDDEAGLTTQLGGGGELGRL